jgi:beta-lactamase regulating signal transducer with metallopeptidase domain
MGYLYILLQYFLHITGHTFAYLATTLIMFYIFKIRDSQVKIFVFILVLIKPLFVIARLIDFNSSSFYNRYSFFYLIKNISESLVKIPETREVNFVLINSVMLVLYFLGLIVAIAWFYRTGIYFNRMIENGSIAEAGDGRIKNSVNYYSEKMGLKPPKIYFASGMENCFYAYGFIKKKIVVNKNMIDLLTDDEQDIVILHELAHIKRNDNFLTAIAIFLKNIHFYNHFSSIAFHSIKIEQENACDKLVLKYAGRTGREIAQSILFSKLKIKSNPGYLPEYNPGLSSSFSTGSTAGEINIKNRIKILVDLHPGKINLNIYARILIYSFFILLLIF